MKKLEILSDLKIFVQQQKIIYATEKYFSSKKQASQLESAELLTPCKQVQMCTIDAIECYNAITA